MLVLRFLLVMAMKNNSNKNNIIIPGCMTTYFPDIGENCRTCFLKKKFEWKISGLKLHFEEKVILDGIHATLFHYI